MTSSEGEAEFKLRLAITSRDCGAGVCTGGCVSHRKALETAKLTSQYLHLKIILKTEPVICDLFYSWGRLLCCWLWWLIFAVPPSRHTRGWSRGGPLKSGWKLQFSSWVQTETGTQVMHTYLTPQCHQPNSSLCWVLNQYIERSSH